MIFITSGNQPMTSHPNWTSTLETLVVQAVDVAAHALVARVVDAAARVVKLQGRSVQEGPIRSVMQPTHLRTHINITNEWGTNFKAFYSQRIYFLNPASFFNSSFLVFCVCTQRG